MKNLIWYYEKETRIVAELKDKFFDTLDKNKDYYIMMTFPPDMNMEITTAPEIENNTEIDFNNYPNILNFIVDTSKLKLSEHCGELKMRLYNNKCDKCKFTFEEKTQQSAEAAAAKE